MIRRLLRPKERRVSLSGHGPYISFTFDDFYHSAVVNGCASLERNGLRATFYVAMGLMDRSDISGQLFELADVASVHRAGHEVASHTMNHRSAAKVDSATFAGEALRGKEAVAKIAGFPASDNFAYPFGVITTEAVKALQPLMRSCRSVQAGANIGFANLDRLFAQAVYGGQERVAEYKTAIDQNCALRGWLIFYTHDIQDEPSQFGCTPDVFERVVEHAIGSGATILPVNEVLDELNAPKVPRPAALTP